AEVYSAGNASCRDTKSTQQIASFNKDTMMNASPKIIQGEGSAGEKAAELFTYCAETSDQDFHEDYLTFCPFPERIPGFSMTRVFLNPKKYRAEMTLIQRKQIEMRQVLFFKEDFTQIRSLLDIGCGHGTDVIQIANYYPHIHTDGFTITKAQAELGNHRIAQKGLNGQARIFNHDSSKVKFPRNDYDVIIGFEVSCLVADKEGLFGNIESSLRNHGRVLLMDFVANLHGAIEDPSIDIYIPTQEQWVKTLAKHHLVIDEIIDVSPQIANFQYDPEHENNVKDCPKVVRDSWRNYANNAIAIERGWLSYMLFRLRKDLYANVAELEQFNLAKLRAPKPYPVALQEMLELSHVPYPILDESLLADAYPDERPSAATPGTASLSRFALLKTKLAGLFEAALSLPPGELERAETFQDLGISSINSVELLQAINGEFGLTLPTSLIFAHNTLDSLTRYLETYLSEHQPQQLEKLNNEPPVTQAANIVENPLAAKLRTLFVRSLALSTESLSADDKFNELGLTSINAVELMQAINAEFQLTLPTSVIFECNSLAALTDYLAALGVSVAGGAQKKSLN
ncbi:MAG: phosphopantetheine-binding protein, partial [Methylobacter sp.]